MTIYNSGNKVPSPALVDLWDNSLSVDSFVNSEEETLTTRTGLQRDTISGIQKKSEDQRDGFQDEFLSQLAGFSVQFQSAQQDKENRFQHAISLMGWQELGDWAIGLTVDNRQQIVYYNGSWYKYLGDLEHVIAGDSPENDGGVWSAKNPTGKWSNIGDAALRSNLSSSEEGMGDDIVTHSDGKTVREHIKYLERDKLSFYDSTATGLLNFLEYAAASGRECIVDTVVNLTVAVNFDAQFSNIHLRWEAPINSDTQLFNLYNLGPKSILKDMWFQNITAPWV